MQDDFANESAAEVQEWSEAISSVIAFEGTHRADEVLAKAVETARRSGARIPFAANTAYMNTITPDEEPPHPGIRKIEQKIRAAVRWNAAAIVLKANKECVRARRPHRQLPIRRHPLRHRLHALLARRGRPSPRRRPDLLPGPFLARHLCPRLPGRPPDRGAAAELPPGGRRQGPLLLSAPLADARLLAIPHRLDGPGPADGDLPGALPEVPARTAASPTPRTARSGCSAATARWTSRNRSAPSHSPGARSSTT